MTTSHNLNIQLYKLTELLNLFNLTYNISTDDLKRAKRIVLKTHPDKSGLGAEYFLFYKKAFDIIVKFYENQQKQNQVVSTEERNYEPININNINKSTVKKVTSVINEMSPEEFNAKFNRLFDDNMSVKVNNTRNEWFTKDDPSYHVDGDVNKQNMGIMFEKIKEKQNSSALSKYRGVENLIISGSGSKLYDDMDDNDEYVQCDPFSKLKYDDLRKVHKDQTMLAVSEKDISKVPIYTSTEQYMRARGQQSLTPLEKQDAERLLNMQDEQFKQLMMQKEYRASLKTMEYEQKNKNILSSFLHLQN
jgi:hypothetical protein